MKVSRPDLLSVNVSYGANKKSKPIATQPKDQYKEENKKLLLGLAGLAVVGAAGIITCIARDNNMSASKYIMNKSEKFFSILNGTPETPEIYKLIGDKRDAAAVKMYKSYVAQNKLDALKAKYYAGEFKDKTSEVYNQIINNMKQLQTIVNAK